MDFKLALTSQVDAAGLKDLATTILSEHGESFDAPRGDFVASVEDPGVVLYVKDVARGDVTTLADDLAERYGAGLGITASYFEHGTWWPLDLESEDD